MERAPKILVANSCNSTTGDLSRIDTDSVLFKKPLIHKNNNNNNHNKGSFTIPTQIIATTATRSCYPSLSEVCGSMKPSKKSLVLRGLHLITPEIFEATAQVWKQTQLAATSCSELQY